MWLTTALLEALGSLLVLYQPHTQESRVAILTEPIRERQMVEDETP
jgi:hypothetical protein